MTEVASDIAFIIPGQLDAMPAGQDVARGVVRASVRVGSTRAGGATVRVVARPGDDVVLLAVANGPTLVLHPEDARDLLRAQAATPVHRARDRSSASLDDNGPAATNEVAVPSQLGWPGLEARATRSAPAGWMGQAVLTGFRVVARLARDPAVTLATAAVTKKVDGQVDCGVYSLAAGALGPLKGSGTKLDHVPAAADGGPLLVLVHGTFSDTPGTFGKLWTMHNPVVRQLFARYGQRVYGFDHPTLGASPIGNALALVQALPKGARLHLLTHSRGGLVAEVLARACSGAALSADEKALFAGKRYAQHRKDLRELFAVARAKGLRIERVVRVACPARGTLLASRRLDAYLSIVSWCLQLAGIPVAPVLVDFLHEVARRRANPAELPGLESMMPGSPVVAWLNTATEPIEGELRVVAGDMEGDSIGSWVKTLLSDAFYWTDNDLVVQTRSMYGGTPRAPTASGGGASFLLDSGGRVSHFNYFGNERTVKAIAEALSSDRPADFAGIGPLSWAGRDASGSRALPAVAAHVAATNASRPAVFLLPGLLASNLAVDGQRIWLGARLVDDLDALRWSRAAADRVEPDGLVAGVYDRLVAQLATSHEVTVFAFDWRRPLEDEARRLADAVDAALTARRASGQPVRLLAHSTGGLLARTLALERPTTWKRLLAVDGARVVMLGTPNGGSWSPMQTLSGDETFGNALVASGSLVDTLAARETMATMPGFLQVQAGLLDPTHRLDRAASWQALAEADLARLVPQGQWHLAAVQHALYAWGVPSQAVLDRAVALRRRLDAAAAAFAGDTGKIAMVVGSAPFTPAGFVLGEAGLEYLDAAHGGDGRVPLADALLPGVPAWTIDAAHGAMASRVDAFPAYLELLATGTTRLLAPLDLGVLSTQTSTSSLAHSRPSRGLLGSLPPSTAADVVGSKVRRSGDDRRGDAALHVSVLNGDLKFVHQPLLVGHYRSLLLTGTEAIVDRLVGGAMSQSLTTGLYPDACGSHQVFGNIRRDPNNVLAMARPLAVVVTGLGEEGKLRAVDLSSTVRQAVLAYAQRLAEQEHGGPAEFEIATTLMGSGGTGVSAGSAAQLIAQGAYDANTRLRERGWPQIGRLIFVEIYLDRASDAWRALQVQATSTQQLKVVGPVLAGAGALRRSLDASYRGAAYDFISVVTGQRADGEPTITYNLDTRRARTEVRAQQAQGTLVRELVASASNDANRDAQIGRTLFDLLVPVELEPFLGGTTEMVIELDAGTAAIPWELLDTPGSQGSQGATSDARPWAIRSKLLRKLRTADFRARVSDADADGSVLVVGEPLVDASLYPPLPGALAEATAVVARLTSGAGGIDAAHVRALVSGSDDARSIINALFERPYRVVHVAGHGAPGPKGGVVLSGDTYLGPAEVAAMRTVPELVFLNCCHLAARDPQATLRPYDRAGFAANIAEALIEIGVRCVVAAGWAVEDEPAALFATTFYDALLRGGRFIDAVAEARAAAWRADPDGNTWAAYQCYGDPGWTWHRHGGATPQGAASLQDEFAAVSSAPALTLALETISIRLRFGGDESRSDASRQGQRDRIRYLESTFAPLWGTMGAVAEAFGLAFADARDLDKAIAWYRTAVAAADGSASFQAVEQLGNQLARRGEAATDVATGRRDIDEGIGILTRLASLQTTAERESLLGSAYKRRVMSADGAVSMAALRSMALHYGRAEQLTRQSGGDNLFYPAKNGIGADLRLAFLERRPAELALDRIEAVRESLERAATERPDFWVVVGQIELRMLTSLAARQLAASADALIGDYDNLKARVAAPGMWDSVHVDARFVIEPYLAAASALEKAAATRLLDALAAMASP